MERPNKSCYSNTILNWNVFAIWIVGQKSDQIFRLTMKIFGAIAQRELNAKIELDHIQSDKSGADVGCVQFEMAQINRKREYDTKGNIFCKPISSPWR